MGRRLFDLLSSSPAMIKTQSTDNDPKILGLLPPRYARITWLFVLGVTFHHDHDPGTEYWQRDDPPTREGLMKCSCDDGEDDRCSGHIPTRGINAAHMKVWRPLIHYSCISQGIYSIWVLSPPHHSACNTWQCWSSMIIEREFGVADGLLNSQTQAYSGIHNK
jgi:hypothetical protein